MIDEAIKQLESLIEERTRLIEANRRKRDQKVRWIAGVRRNIEALEMAIATLGYARHRHGIGLLNHLHPKAPAKRRGFFVASISSCAFSRCG